MESISPWNSIFKWNMLVSHLGYYWIFFCKLLTSFFFDMILVAFLLSVSFLFSPPFATNNCIRWQQGLPCLPLTIGHAPNTHCQCADCLYLSYVCCNRGVGRFLYTRLYLIMITPLSWTDSNWYIKIRYNWQWVGGVTTNVRLYDGTM